MRLENINICYKTGQSAGAVDTHWHSRPEVGQVTGRAVNPELTQTADELVLT